MYRIDLEASVRKLSPMHHITGSFLIFKLFCNCFLLKIGHTHTHTHATACNCNLKDLLIDVSKHFRSCVVKRIIACSDLKKDLLSNSRKQSATLHIFLKCLCLIFNHFPEMNFYDFLLFNFKGEKNIFLKS